MSGNTTGERFKVTIFGESHGTCIGVVVDGCPAGLRLREEDIQTELDRRRPGQSVVSTRRAERDTVAITSGVFRGLTTGAPICMTVPNLDVDSSPYEAIKDTPRPGHGDYTWRIKYRGFNDYRGGGRSSGRVTAAMVATGAVAKKLLGSMGVEVVAYTVQIADVRARGVDYEGVKELAEKSIVRCADPKASERMVEKIAEAREDGDSLGGVVQCVALGVPVGLGEPIYDTIEGDVAKALFAIPAVKGVEFGAGFAAAEMRGSEHNDPFSVRDGRVIALTNNAGGILGGISTGMPIVVRVAIKPTPSIAKPQRTVNLSSMEEAEIAVGGRHDPCIVPRAVPVVEAAVAAVLVDHALRAGLIPSTLKS